MKRNILKILFFLIPFFSYSQKQGNIWYFGDHAGLDFNNGGPIPLTNGATYNGDQPNGHSEGTSVICDNLGSLLFYTNGQQIWNSSHQIMPNGDGLLGHWSSTQSALIVAQPGSSRYFYVFTTDAFVDDNLKYGFRYSIVDICLDNGLGDVIPANKNILLLDTVAEKLTAVRHSNGVDYWIITHKYYSDAFYSFHLSSNGIINTVISLIGSYHPAGFVGVGGSIGQLKASPDGKKLALVNANGGNNNIAEYFDFDKNTGVVSNCVSIQTNPVYNYYGVSFSPDNSKLYISCIINNIGTYQFDLNAGNGNPAAIIASKTLVADWGYYGIQLGVNGKIYLTRVGQYVSVINNPNELGLNCNYQDSAIYLDGKKSSFGLPNFIDSYDYSNTTFNSVACIEYEIVIPNVYTPNADNINDTFIIKNLPEGSTVHIYNRWGALLFESNKPNNFWDGRTKSGAEVSAGVYYYIINLPNNERRKGFVEVIK